MAHLKCGQEDEPPREQTQFYGGRGPAQRAEPGLLRTLGKGQPPRGQTQVSTPEVRGADCVAQAESSLFLPR